MNGSFISGEGPSGASFPTTVWQDVLRAGDPGSPENRERLAFLIERYWPPVFCYVRSRWPRLNLHEVEDRTQGFFASLLERGTLERADPARGSFRGYLKKALGNYLVDAERAARARRPHQPLISLDAAQFQLLDERVDPDPGRALDRAWYRLVLRRALDRLRRRLERSGRDAYYEVFVRYYLSAEEHTHASLAQALGLTPNDVNNYLRYCRLRLRPLILEQTADYTSSPAEAERELQEILAS